MECKATESSWRYELVNLKLSVNPCFEENSVILLMFHRGLGACDDTRAEYLGLRIQTLGWTCKLEGQQ